MTTNEQQGNSYTYEHCGHQTVLTNKTKNYIPKCKTCKQNKTCQKYLNRGLELLIDKNQIKCLKCERIYNRDPNNYMKDLNKFKCYCQQHKSRQEGEMKFYDELIKQIPNVIKSCRIYNIPRKNYSSDFHVIRDGIIFIIHFDDKSHQGRKNQQKDLIKLDICLKREDVYNIYIQKETFENIDPSVFWSLLLAEINQPWKDEKVITFGYGNFYDYIHNHTEVRRHLFDDRGKYLYDEFTDFLNCVIGRRPFSKVSIEH